MDETDAIAVPAAPDTLLLPAWVEAALAAHERLGLCLDLLQAAACHAREPGAPAPERGSVPEAAARAEAWLRELPGSALRVGGQIEIPRFGRLVRLLGEELDAMARPLLRVAPADFAAQVKGWHEALDRLADDRLSPQELHWLAHGQRGQGASLRLFALDLHEQLERLRASLASERLDGAHVRHIDAADHARVRAFMRGLNRTAPLKLDHPGLDAAAARDGDALLLQVDLGRDAHLLLIRVQAPRLVLACSDAHRGRLEFLRRMLVELGARWSAAEGPSLTAEGACHAGTATFEPADEAGLQAVLEAVGARLVFLLEWNRARKRLMHFVNKEDAIAVLAEAARREVGHLPWLRAGGEQLVYGAMQALGDSAFRIGDRLEDVLGREGTRDFLVETLRLASEAMCRGRSAAEVADGTRRLLAGLARRHTAELDLLVEHAACCRALARAVADLLEPGDDVDPQAAEAVAARAQGWARRAGHLVMQARSRVERQPRWGAFVPLFETADEVADALEEGVFLLSLAADAPHVRWDAEVRGALAQLAQTVLGATQDHLRAIEVMRARGACAEAAEHDTFLAASWGLQCAERHCDELLRQARRQAMRRVREPAALMLANDLAMALELACDRLLAAACALRSLAAGPAEAAAPAGPAGG